MEIIQMGESVRASGGFARVRTVVPTLHGTTAIVSKVAGRYIWWRALCQSGRLPVKLNRRYGGL